MLERNETDPRLTAIEALLTGLKPAPAALDREQLFFRAGQTSAARGQLAWPVVAALLLLTTSALGTALFLRPAPAEHIVYLPSPAPPPPPEPRIPAPTSPVYSDADPTPADTTAWNYLQLRDQVVRWGGEALPDPLPRTSSNSDTMPDRLFDMRPWLPDRKTPTKPKTSS